VLRELAFRHQDLTSTADRATAAHGVDVDAECPGRGEQRRADRESPSFTGRREDDEWIPAAHGTSLRQE
jgi:hypothetical protein